MGTEKVLKPETRTIFNFLCKQTQRVIFRLTAKQAKNAISSNGVWYNSVVEANSTAVLHREDLEEAMPEFVLNDGGRKAAGYRGFTGDCVCRSIAIATGKSYQDVYNDLNEWGHGERRSKRRTGKSSARTGVHKPTIRRYMESLGWAWTPTMQIGSGCKVHLRADELPGGRLVVSVSKHLTAVLDGVVHDTHDPSRTGTRCVYGYYSTA